MSRRRILQETRRYADSLIIQRSREGYDGNAKLVVAERRKVDAVLGRIKRHGDVVGFDQVTADQDRGVVRSSVLFCGLQRVLPGVAVGSGIGRREGAVSRDSNQRKAEQDAQGA